MPVDRFVDTNILLYAYDLDAPEKRAFARSIIKNRYPELFEGESKK